MIFCACFEDEVARIFITPTHVGRMDHDSPELLDKNFVPLKIQDFDSWNSEPEESTFHETFNRISSQTSLQMFHEGGWVFQKRVGEYNCLN